MTERGATWIGAIVAALLIAALALPFAARRCVLADDTSVACTVIVALGFHP